MTNVLVDATNIATYVLLTLLIACGILIAWQRIQKKPGKTNEEKVTTPPTRL